MIRQFITMDLKYSVQLVQRAQIVEFNPLLASVAHSDYSLSTHLHLRLFYSYYNALKALKYIFN